jgi:hypothetical protein
MEEEAMLDENSTLESNETNETPEAQPPEESGNKTFLIVGGIFAGLIFLTLVCMAVYFLVIQPRVTASQATQLTATAQGNAAAMARLTSTAQAALWTKTSEPAKLPTNTQPAPTLGATNTAVVNVVEPTATATSDAAALAAMQAQLADQMTQTVSAQGTQAAAAQAPLPVTGFADEVGLPLLILLTFALLAVIFIARRMRKAPTR